MEIVNSIKGKVLLVSNSDVYFSRGLTIFKSSNEGHDYKIFYKFKKSNFIDFTSLNHLTSRLFRSGIHHFIAVDDGFYIFYNRFIVKVDLKGNLVGKKCQFKGSRPLCVTTEGNSVLYGEYYDNQERRPVDVVIFDGASLKVKYTFTGIRHIHGIFTDHYTGKVYVTTGDYGDEAGIWLLDNGLIKKIIGGTQQERAVQLLFTSKYIYYGTDSPIEKNFIYRIDKDTYQRDCLGSVCSSVFYGALVHEVPFFCTVAEPSDVNPDNKAVLYKVTNEEVRAVSSHRKDFFSKIYFQYGQLNFPVYRDNFRTENKIWLYQLSVKGSGESHLLALDH